MFCWVLKSWKTRKSGPTGTSNHRPRSKFLNKCKNNQRSRFSIIILLAIESSMTPLMIAQCIHHTKTFEKNNHYRSALTKNCVTNHSIWTARTFLPTFAYNAFEHLNSRKVPELRQRTLYFYLLVLTQDTANCFTQIPTCKKNVPTITQFVPTAKSALSPQLNSTLEFQKQMLETACHLLLP